MSVPLSNVLRSHPETDPPQYSIIKAIVLHLMPGLVQVAVFALLAPIVMHGLLIFSSAFR
jgi:hypothetical protein